MATEHPEIMTVTEICNYLRIPRSSLYKLAQEGKIPCQKVGRHWRFRKEAIDRWLEETPLNIQTRIQNVSNDITLNS